MVQWRPSVVPEEQAAAVQVAAQPVALSKVRMHMMTASQAVPSLALTELPQPAASLQPAAAPLLAAALAAALAATADFAAAAAAGPVVAAELEAGAAALVEAVAASE